MLIRSLGIPASFTAAHRMAAHSVTCGEQRHAASAPRHRYPSASQEAGSGFQAQLRGRIKFSGGLAVTRRERGSRSMRIIDGVLRGRRGHLGAGRDCVVDMARPARINHISCVYYRRTVTNPTELPRLRIIAIAHRSGSSAGGRSVQSGRTSAPIIPHRVQAPSYPSPGARCRPASAAAILFSKCFIFAGNPVESIISAAFTVDER
jgi:hypothetical protein